MVELAALAEIILSLLIFADRLVLKADTVLVIIDSNRCSNYEAVNTHLLVSTLSRTDFSKNYFVANNESVDIKHHG